MFVCICALRCPWPSQQNDVHLCVCMHACILSLCSLVDVFDVRTTRLEEGIQLWEEGLHACNRETIWGYLGLIEILILSLLYLWHNIPKTLQSIKASIFSLKLRVSALPYGVPNRAAGGWIGLLHGVYGSGISATLESLPLLTLKDLYEEIIIRSLKRVGSLGSR